jgi:5'-3' exonuclease
MNTDCLEKIEFSSETEYYNYYLGINDSMIDKNTIKKMVKDYITGMEWCINYYLNDCKSWSWGYNFMIAPLINDILKYFPKSIKIENDIRVLCPVEQLLLAIPIDTYKYVISKSLINKMKQNKEIGYMFPETFDIDINKESVFWKCQVKIPMVEYYEYIKNIKLINIHDEKNEILNNIYN